MWGEQKNRPFLSTFYIFLCVSLSLSLLSLWDRHTHPPLLPPPSRSPRLPMAPWSPGAHAHQVWAPGRLAGTHSYKYGVCGAHMSPNSSLCPVQEQRANPERGSDMIWVPHTTVQGAPCTPRGCEEVMFTCARGTGVGPPGRIGRV